MPRYFIKLAYNGANYHGWQSQQNAHSVQDELERCLSLKVGSPIRLTGCGRTDAGVHALVFYAHFDLEFNHEVVLSNHFLNQLNVFLPEDIVVYGIYQVESQAHARFDAISRTYQYRIAREKNPFLIDQAFYHYGKLHIDAMQQAANLLLEFTDFTSFSKLHSQTKTNDCIITRAEWVEQGDELIFFITANRFLRNMVRAVVGTLIEVGQGKMTQNQFKEVILARDRSAAGYSVPPHALYLLEVLYPGAILNLLKS